MDIKQKAVSFRPVRTLEHKLGTEVPIENGHLYFTIDTQKIFLGMPNGEKMSMGGNTGIFYGIKEIEYPDDGNEPDPEVSFSLGDEIEGSRLPLIDDLILNIDGCFYRVVDILDETSVLTNRLTLRGGGGGGGSTPGAATFKINVFSSTGGYYSSSASKIPVNIVAYSTDLDNYISQIECSFDKDFSNIFLIKNTQVSVEQVVELDLIEQKHQFNEYGKKVYFRVSDKYGTVRSSSLIITIATLELATNEEKMLQVKDSTLFYVCNVGGTNGIIDKKVEFHFYNKDKEELTEFYQYLSLGDSQSGSVTKELQVSEIPHGSYEMRVILTGTINGAFISSNELIHKFIRYDSDVGQPIYTYLVPETTEQYTDISVQYLLTYGNETQSYAMDIFVDNDLLSTQIITTDLISNYVFSFDKTGTYKITFQIADLNIEESFNLVITKYTGTLPVVDINDDSLQVYLTAKGRTNNNADKEYWPDYKNPTKKASLSDFYYRGINGWMIDEEGVNYLKLSQGANAELPYYTPFDGTPTEKGLTIELDFMLTGILDYDAHFIECLSYNADDTIKTGFVVQGDQFKYYASSAEEPLFSLSLVQNRRIRLSVVIESESIDYPMCYAYLNGIISNAINYGKKDNFANGTKKAYLKFDSQGGEIRIYNIRIYNVAKDRDIILNNYQASLSSLEERQMSYEENNIWNSVSKNITLESIEAEGYPLQIPYVKIIGGYKSDTEFIMGDKAEDNILALPTAKKDFRAIDIEIIYPTEEQNPYFKDYENFSLKTTFEDSNLDVLNGFGKQALTGTIMYAQGTSSLEYPVKNLRMKFKGKKIKVRPDLEAVDLITFKADFMESSGSHNTGAANFIDTAYKSAKMSTPGQDHYNDESIVTCIKGHPCVIFWSDTGEQGSFKYIGKYNLNLDKATPEPFGFKHDDDFGWEKDEEDNFVLDDDGNKINSIYCFEFLDNNAKVCNFLSDEIASSNPELTTAYDKYYDTWHSEREIDEEGTIGPGWRVGFESRYPEDKEGTYDAEVLFPLASWLNELYDIYTQELSEGKKPTDIEYEYEYTQATEFNENVIYYILNNETEYEVAYPNADNFSDDVYYTRRVKSSTYAMESIRRFKDEYQRHLDPDFLLAYYIITEVLLMADSRVKNMMIATWGKEHRTFTKIDGTEESVYNYIWYPIFYDMDTMLGLDNIGYVNKNYYDEDTTETVFNGDEVLWKFVRDALPNELNQFYNRLEQSKSILTKNAILPFFNDNQANLANETFYNEDAIYKYINTFRTGYKDDLHGTEIGPGEGSRLYAAQGDRSMMRDWFLDNRIKYVRGKRSSINYQSGDRIEFRLTYPKYQETADNQEEQNKINASIKAVPPSGEFKFKSLKTGFAGVKIGKNSVPVNKRFVDVQEQTIAIDTSSGNGTETYLLGLSNLSSVGDLSDKYLYKLVVGTNENNLKSLILGNHHKDYYNPFWGEERSIELTSFRFLEEFNLENCGTFRGTINFSNSPQIKIIKLNGSKTSGLTLPVGGVIEELRVPTSVNDFELDSHPTLSNENFTIGYYDYDLNRYINDFSRLQYVSIIGCPNIDTYNLIRAATFKHETISILDSYCFQDFNWNITEAEDLLYENNYISGIIILDQLLERNPYNNITRAASLIGNIEINVSNTVVNEYEIYQKYHNVFPNLTISYGDKVQVEKASKISFYNLEEINENTIPYYTVLSNGSQDLKHLTSADGPAGSALSKPQKPSTTDTDYAFSGSWKIIESQDENLVVGSTINEADFEDCVPTGNLKLVPIFNSSVRLYEITLYDYNGEVLIRENLSYNTDIGEALKDNTKSYYNYREYNGNKENYRYEFKGWQSEYNYHNNPNILTYTTLKGKKVEGKLKLYAYYKEEDASKNSSNLEFFNIDINNTAIQIKNELKTIIKGKVTFPSQYENQSLTKIKKFNNIENNNLVTHFYFMEDAKYSTIEAEAFINFQALEKIINFPSSIITLDNEAFKGCSNLQMSVLPEGLKTIGVACFSECKKLTITEFGTENSAPNLATIKIYAFNQAGDSVSSLITIGGGNKRLVIADWAFEKYGTDIPEVDIKSNVECSSEALGFELIDSYVIEG